MSLYILRQYSGTFKQFFIPCIGSNFLSNNFLQHNFIIHLVLPVCCSLLLHLLCFVFTLEISSPNKCEYCYYVSISSHLNLNILIISRSFLLFKSFHLFSFFFHSLYWFSFRLSFPLLYLIFLNFSSSINTPTDFNFFFFLPTIVHRSKLAFFTYCLLSPASPICPRRLPFHVVYP